MMNKQMYQSTIFFGLITLLILFNDPLMAQIKMGDNPRSINQDAILELESKSKGLLLPRLSLQSTSKPDPLQSFVSGMLIYNTATANDVSPGIYFSDGTKWIKANTPNVGIDTSWGQQSFWSLRGNSGVNGNQFLGTANKFPLVVKTNSAERMRITESGWVGIGTATPQAALQVKGQLIIDTLSAGSLLTDKLLVANPADGRVKLISSAPFTTAAQTITITVSTSGQAVFPTPGAITDSNKIFLYRNGVLINFSVNNSTSIIAELPCNVGDQIKIIQLL